MCWVWAYLFEIIKKVNAKHAQIVVFTDKNNCSACGIIFKYCQHNHLLEVFHVQKQQATRHVDGLRQKQLDIFEKENPPEISDGFFCQCLLTDSNCRKRLSAGMSDFEGVHIAFRS